ncbi:alpha-2-macroglobulin family protein [Dysgonomonas sp. Shenzhen-Wh21]
MVTPNMPRFVRQGDKTSISTKISNLSENAISGNVRIEFFDPATDKAIDLRIPNQDQKFSVDKGASTSAQWTFDVPEGIELIGCRIVAQNKTFSDGEQHVLAVLSNRMMVTESMPIDVTKAGTNTFTFDKLYNNTSSTASNYRLTLEYASNPAWYAIQALPSFSNPTSENAVNWFASYYVNTLGSSIIRQYPKVGSMIEAWKKQGGDKQTFVSKLQKDEELKNVLLEETPWVLDAKNEAEQMQRLSLLFDLNNTKQMTNAATKKLQDLQNTNDGGWSWYKGMYPSRSVTQYILYGYAKLQLVGQVEYHEDVKEMQMNALKFIDSQILKDFEKLKENNKNWEKTTSVSTNQLEYAYVRSFYRDIPIDQATRAAERFYTNVASKNWQKLDLYEKSILSVVLKRNGEKELANKIIKSIREYAVKNEKAGMYWPNNRNQVFMSLSPISVHTFLMDALQEVGSSQEEMDMLKRWLINQKRTQIWESTHASIDAISALLSTGSEWFASEETPVISVGNKKIEPENKEAGTGYFKKVWDKAEIKNEMGKVEVTTSDTRPAYGALYWQYYESLDKITAHKGDLNVEKQLFKEINTATGKSLSQITENNPLAVGDKVVVRLTVRTDKDMEFVHLKDMRASCFEPIQTISGIKWNEGLMYYQTSKDASTNFYFDVMPKGTYVFEYPVYVNRIGEYANGITTIQCMYAPEFVSHTAGIKITVKEKE